MGIDNFMRDLEAQIYDVSREHMKSVAEDARRKLHAEYPGCKFSLVDAAPTTRKTINALDGTQFQVYCAIHTAEDCPSIKDRRN